MEIIPERALVPPLGLITVAALCPKRWEIRLLDLAFDELRDEDLLWADLVMVSAMEGQHREVHQTLERASRLGPADHDRRPLCQQRTREITATG